MRHTLLLLSNSSLIKRSIIEVFPTPVSPRKTSLNLVSHRLVLYYIRLAFPASIIQEYYKEN